MYHIYSVSILILWYSYSSVRSSNGTCSFLQYFNVRNETDLLLHQLDQYYANNQKSINSPFCKLNLNKDFKINFIMDLTIYATTNQKFFYGELIRSFRKIYGSVLHCQITASLYIFRDGMLGHAVPIILGDR